MPSPLEARVDKHDRQIAAIQKLILAGMKILVENGKQIKANAAAIKETNKTLDRFIRSLEGRSRNGHR
jgi:hypothetical protein